MLDYMKSLKDWMTMTCHLYDSKCGKMLTIACCGMQSKDGATQKLLWKILNVVMVDDGVPYVNFKGFITKNA